MTPKGTKPGEHASLASAAHTSSGIASSSRYTPPIPQSMKESPRWVPILMFALLALGVISIVLRYLVWTNSNTPVLIGLGFMLAGLFVATKWE